MNNRSTIKKIGFVAFSNIIKLISSILISFFIPNILGLTNYGYYRVFILYLAYGGLFHFGLIDGIYLTFGGIDYDNLDRKKFRTYFSFLLKLESIISLIGIIFTYFFISGEKKLIFILLFVSIIATNLTNFYQFISQITGRFKEYSIIIITLSFLNIVLVALMFFSKTNDYRVYILMLVLLNYLILFAYLYIYRDITFGIREKIMVNMTNIINFFIIGIPLLLANLASTVILTVDKQIVEIFFDIKIFGIYSFAYSMLALITVVVSAVGVVLYPTLKKTNLSNIGINYSRLNIIVISFVLVGLFGYFPLLWIIPKYLPEYIGSLVIFRIALPGLILSSSISSVKLNFFKITNTTIFFFIISLLVILINLGLNLAAYFVYYSTSAIAISSIVGLAIWYILTEIYLVRKHHSKWLKNSLLIILGMTLFYFLTSFQNYVVSGIIYISLVLVLIFLFNKTEIKTLICNLKHR